MSKAKKTGAAPKKASTRGDKSAPAAVTGGAVIEDIHYVEVRETQQVREPEPVITAVVEPEPPKLEVMIADEKAKFNLPEEVIKSWEVEYGTLTIAGPEDVAGYEKVKATWNYVRSRRTAVEGKGLEIRQRFNAINKAVKSEEERLIELISPIEKRLEKLKTDWEAADKLRKEEAKRKEEERLNGRLQELIGLGMALVDGYYSIGDTITTDVATLRTLPDEKYLKFLEKVQNKAAELAETKAAEDRERQAAQDRLDEQQRAVDAQREELEKKQRELDETLRKANEALEQAAKARRELRLNRLELVGLVLQAGGKEAAYVNEVGNIRVDVDSMGKLSDDEFTALLERSKGSVAELRDLLQKKLNKEDEERRERETKIAAAHEKLTAAGLSYDMGRKVFAFKNAFMDHLDTLEELLQLSPLELDHYAAEIGKQVVAAKAKQVLKEQEDRAAAEKERIAKQSDSERLLGYLQALNAVEPPDMASLAYQDHIHQLTGRMHSLLNEYEVIAEKEAVPHGSQ